MVIIRFFIVSAVVSLISPTLLAKPHVGFVGSAAYLVDERADGAIKFKMTEAIPMEIPAHSYNLNVLEDFVSAYPLANLRLKEEFVRMFDECFLSEFSMGEFLETFVKLLRSFQETYPQHVR